MKRASLTIFTIMMACIIFAAYLYLTASSQPSSELKIFCAGSLALPLNATAHEFEATYPKVKVVIEPSGSVMAVRKVTDLSREADILALADYRLIPKFLMPNYTNFCICFATNELVLAYTPSSRYANEINESNWYQILLHEDVKFGFSSPNDDPCGYRALMSIALAGLHYGISLLDQLIVNNSNIWVEKTSEEFHIYVPPDLTPTSDKLVIRHKSVDLIALLEAGTLDYAFEYKSVAIQHGLNFVSFPKEINLASPDLADLYSKVHVHIFAGSGKESVLSGAPIVYGVTILDNAPNRKAAISFIKFLLSSTGKSIFEQHGQDFLEPYILIGEAPEELNQLLK